MDDVLEDLRDILYDDDLKIAARVRKAQDLVGDPEEYDDDDQDQDQDEDED